MATFQHFVPRFYLRGFLDPVSVGHKNEPPYLWITDIENKRVNRRYLKKTAGFSGYYDLQPQAFENTQFDLDKSITTFETRAAPIILKIRNGQFQTTVEERYHVANFIGIQIGRVPIFRRHVEHSIDNTPYLWIQDYVKDESKLRRRFGENADQIKEYILSGKLKI
jgi:hypothetical protein